MDAVNGQAGKGFRGEIMKRQAEDMEALVYAHGCGQPISGFGHALAEVERQRELWDQLVDIERDCERKTLEAAAADVSEIAVLLGDIDRLSERQKDRTLDRVTVREIVHERRGLYTQLWPLLGTWRKEHKDVLTRIEHERRARVKAARQATDCWWPNYNRVLDDYERSRRVVWQFGRRLRKADLAADNGCLTVQIQRTRTGLGAAPAELFDGTCSMLSLGRVDPRAHDLATFRGERDRLARSVIEMRVDCDGNLIRLPFHYHRPLPEGARVKRAQLVWRRQAGKLRYLLALTVSRPATVVMPSGDREIDVVVDWRVQDDGALLVAQSLLENLTLSAEWMRRMDRVEHLHGVLDRWYAQRPAIAHTGGAAVLAEIIAARLKGLPKNDPARFWYGLWKRWRDERENLRDKLLHQRREIYRLYAKRILSGCRVVRITSPILAAVAQTERENPMNSLRFRACTHSLVAEIEHQARKQGVVVKRASAPVSAGLDPKKIRHVSKRQRAEMESARNNAPPAALG